MTAKMGSFIQVPIHITEDRKRCQHKNSPGSEGLCFENFIVPQMVTYQYSITKRLGLCKQSVTLQFVFFL